MIRIKIKLNGTLKGSVEVYKSEQRKIAKGDVIRITRTKDDEQIKNGERYKIKDIHEDKVIVEGQDGKEKAYQEVGLNILITAIVVLFIPLRA